MQISKFNIFSTGYAAENKTLSSKELQVFPAEILPYVDGEVIFEPIEIEESGEDYFGEQYTVKVETSLSINCTWLQMGSNRQTPPDIRRGERILIYRYADTDKYYWATLGMDEHLRRLETVVYAWSNIREGNIEALTPDNSYYAEISTHNKHITLQTNKSDGEPFAYTIQIETKEGNVVISDDAGTFIHVESAQRRVEIQNKDTSRIIIDKGKGYFITPESIEMVTRDYSVKCETALLNATKSVTVVSPLLTGNIEDSIFNGKVRTNGLLTIAAGFAAIPGGGGSTGSISIPMEFTGNTDFNTTVKIDGITVNTHNHSNPEGGAVGPMQ
jgi:hypothetical protein